MTKDLTLEGKEKRSPTYRNSRFLLKRLQAMYGDDFHPIIKNAENATALQEIADEICSDRKALGDHSSEGEKLKGQEIAARKAASDAWEKLSPYFQPKLKQVEVTQDEGNKFDTLTQEDRLRLLEQYNDSIE